MAAMGDRSLRSADPDNRSPAIVKQNVVKSMHLSESGPPMESQTQLLNQKSPGTRGSAQDGKVSPRVALDELLDATRQKKQA